MAKNGEKSSKMKGLKKWSFVAFGAFLSASQLYAATPDRLAEVRKQMFPDHSDQQIIDGAQKYKGSPIQLSQAEYYDYVPGSNLPYVSDYYAYSAYGDYYNYSNYSDSSSD